MEEPHPLQVFSSSSVPREIVELYPIGSPNLNVKGLSNLFARVNTILSLVCYKEILTQISHED